MFIIVTDFFQLIIFIVIVTEHASPASATLIGGSVGGILILTLIIAIVIVIAVRACYTRRSQATATRASTQCGILLPPIAVVYHYLLNHTHMHTHHHQPLLLIYRNLSLNQHPNSPSHNPPIPQSQRLLPLPIISIKHLPTTVRTRNHQMIHPPTVILLMM